MASGYTANYGLCQWQAEDKFLREEFNQDNEKIDTAIQAVADRAAAGQTATEQAQSTADQALEGLELVNYNLYNLLLQNSYEKKETSWKKALLFDGFLDGAGLSSKSEVLLQRDGMLVLDGKGQGDHDLGYDADARKTDLTTRTVSISGCGRLTGFRLKVFLNWYPDATPTLKYELTRNGDLAASGSYSWKEPCTNNVITELTMEFTSPLLLLPRDTVALRLYSSGTMWELCQAGSGTGLGGTFLITPITGESAEVLTKSQPLPAARRVRAWVRHSGGSVGLTLRDGEGQEYPMTPGGARTVKEPLGKKSCTEQEFSLDADVPQGNLSLRLALTRGGSTVMYLYDYGATLF